MWFFFKRGKTHTDTKNLLLLTCYQHFDKVEEPKIRDGKVSKRDKSNDRSKIASLRKKICFGLEGQKEMSFEKGKMGRCGVKRVVDMVSVFDCVSVSGCGIPDTGIQERASSHFLGLLPFAPNKAAFACCEEQHKSARQYK